MIIKTLIEALRLRAIESEREEQEQIDQAQFDLMCGCILSERDAQLLRDVVRS
tara:strand:+ start:353 stop:511 length:159 start_codon:yes stop_codon:yes gene_type:complete